MWRSKRPGTQQGRIEHVGPVRGGHHDHRLGLREAVHLAEDLVERLLAFVVAAAEPGPRCRPMASISSMKRIEGEFALAVAKRSRTRPAPTPTNIWMNSEPLMEKKGTPASPATARPKSVLPVPGGPISNMPLGTRPPSRCELRGVLEELDDFFQLALTPSRPATSLNVIALIAFFIAAGRALAEPAQQAAGEHRSRVRRNMNHSPPEQPTVIRYRAPSA